MIPGWPIDCQKQYWFGCYTECRLIKTDILIQPGKCYIWPLWYLLARRTWAQSVLKWHYTSSVHSRIILYGLWVCAGARGSTSASVHMYETNRTIIIRCKQATCYTHSLRYHNSQSSSPPSHYLHHIYCLRRLSLIPQVTSNDCFINSLSSGDSKIVWFLSH